jgi:hypothetical protein
VTRVLKPLVAGVLIGVSGTLLVAQLAESSEKEVPERLEEALHCSDGPVSLPAAIAHHTGRYSEWAVTHAIRIVGIGCDTGPATIFMQFSPYRSELAHALATIRGFGTVCVVDHGVFDGKSLNGRTELEELCSAVDGEMRSA